MRPRLLAVAVLVLLAGPAARAETVYKCLADGRTIYQQTPCARTQRQETIQLQDAAPAGGRVAPMPAAPPRPAAADAPALPASPVAPPPVMYGCIRATDGEPYRSENGQPDPYLAPSGVLGNLGGSLSDAYDARNAAIASAPELNRGRGNVSALVNRNYVWVQDQCRALTPDETCRLLRDDADANQKAIRHAFKSDRPPLEATDARLRDQLRGCR